MVKKYIHFEKERFRLEDSRRLKSDAQKVAEKYRKNGWKARIKQNPTNKRWLIYVKRKLPKGVKRKSIHPNSKIIEGKKFILMRTHKNKKSTQSLAKELRGKGNLVRIIGKRGDWGIYSYRTGGR